MSFKDRFYLSYISQIIGAGEVGLDESASGDRPLTGGAGSN